GENGLVHRPHLGQHQIGLGPIRLPALLQTGHCHAPTAVRVTRLRRQTLVRHPATSSVLRRTGTKRRFVIAISLLQRAVPLLLQVARTLLEQSLGRFPLAAQRRLHLTELRLPLLLRHPHGGVADLVRLTLLVSSLLGSP